MRRTSHLHGEKVKGRSPSRGDGYLQVCGEGGKDGDLVTFEGTDKIGQYVKVKWEPDFSLVEKEITNMDSEKTRIISTVLYHGQYILVGIGVNLWTLYKDINIVYVCLCACVHTYIL